MEKINVEAIHSPARKHLPWLIAIAVSGTLIGAIADIVSSVMEEETWWGFVAIEFCGSVCAMIIETVLLYGVLKTTGRRLLSIPLYIATASLYCALWLLIGVTELNEMELDEYNAIGIIVIVAGILSAVGWIAMQITMWKRLKRSFDGALGKVGVSGMTIVKWALIAIGGLLVALKIGSIAGEEAMIVLLALVACAAVIILTILIIRYYKAILQVMVRCDDNDDTPASIQYTDNPEPRNYKRSPNKTKSKKILWLVIGGIVAVSGIIAWLSTNRDNNSYAYEYTSVEEDIAPELCMRLKHDYNCYRGIVRFCDNMKEIIERAHNGESLFDWSQLPEDEQLMSSDNPDTVTYKRLQHIDRKTYKEMKSYFESKDNASPLFGLLPEFCAVSDGGPFESDAGYTEAEYGNIIVLHLLDKEYVPDWTACFAMNMRGYLDEIHITGFKERRKGVYEVEFSTSPGDTYVIDYSGDKVGIECD